MSNILIVCSIYISIRDRGRNSSHPLKERGVLGTGAISLSDRLQVLNSDLNDLK